MMKRFVAAALFVFWAAFAAILTAGLILYGPQQSVQLPGGNQTAQNASVQSLALTPEEVAKHNSAGDCWLIISGKVYDVSGYLYIHPGGPDSITPYCGRDATVAFDTKDQNKPHSAAAQSLLSLYYKGDLNQNIVQQQPPATPAGTVSTQQVLARFPGSQIVSVSPRGDGNYYVIFTYDGRTYRASVDMNGNLLRRQSSDDD